jgi:hypothetical protein
MVMRQCLFFPFLLLPVVVPWAAALPQAANSPPKAELKSKSRLAKPDEKILLSRAEQGQASSQMWLGAGYEQGWFGKTNFPEAFKTLIGEARDKGETIWECSICLVRELPEITFRLTCGLSFLVLNQTQTSLLPKLT